MDELDVDDDAPRLARATALTSVPPFFHERKEKKWKLWSPFVNEYNKILEDPKKAFHWSVQLFVSKEREFTYGSHRPIPKHFLNVKVDLPDDRGVKRRVFLHFCKENCMVGSIAATLIGVSTGLYTPSREHLAPLYAQKKAITKTINRLTSVAFSGTLLTATLTRKLVTRAVIGGCMYDAIKRSRDEKDYLNHYLNAGCAGAVCGLVFGIRGGLPHAWACAAFASTCSVLAEFIPWKFSDSGE